MDLVDGQFGGGQGIQSSLLKKMIDKGNFSHINQSNP